MADTGCCGSNFSENSASMLGLMTLSFPVIVSSLFLIPILAIAGIFNLTIKRLKLKVLVVLKANLNLIHLAPLMPKARCIFAGKLFSFSPKLSGISYRCFNLALLSLLWFGAISFFYLSIRFISK